MDQMEVLTYKQKYFFNFSVYIGVEPINSVMIVSGRQQRDSAIPIHVSILP